MDRVAAVKTHNMDNVKYVVSVLEDERTTPTYHFEGTNLSKAINAFRGACSVEIFNASSCIVRLERFKDGKETFFSRWELPEGPEFDQFFNGDNKHGKVTLRLPNDGFTPQQHTNIHAHFPTTELGASPAQIEESFRRRQGGGYSGTPINSETVTSRGWPPTKADQSIENAHLIAAAPDLLAALKRWQDEWVMNPDPSQRANNYAIELQIRVAILKAEGGAK